MECKKVMRLLPGYLDGALPSGAWSETHVMIGHHLEGCDKCRHELQAYHALSSLMSRVERAVPPPDLALRIRVAAAQRLSENPWLHYARRLRTEAHLILKNILEPLALPATGGLTVALAVFVIVCQLLGLGAPLRAYTNDSPTWEGSPMSVTACAAPRIVGDSSSCGETIAPRLSVVVVNYVHWADTIRLVRALHSTDAVRSGQVEIVIIDRLSTAER